MPARSVFSSGFLISTLAVVAMSVACSSSDEGSDATSGSGGAGGGVSGSAGTGTSGTSGASGAVGAGGLSVIPDGGAIAEDLCGSSGCTCSNGLDDDNDGKIDGLDEECTGPLDNDEGSFATGIPGDNIDPKWQDCFFDGNSGAGDDECRYHTDCLYGVKTADDADCQVADTCRDFCAARTPNGCDCFGCCSVNTGTGTIDIQIGENCSLEDVSDEDACPPCIKTTECGNECGECELCPGRTVDDLPASCTPVPPPDGGPPPPSYTCDNGEQVCTSTADCEPSYYCSLGCCLPSLR